MKCLEAEREILSRVDDVSFPAELKSHLLQCDSCSSLLRQLKEVDAVFGSAAIVEPSPYLWTRIESRLSECPQSLGWVAWHPLRTQAWLTLAVLVLFSFCLTFFQTQPPLGLERELAENRLLPSVTAGTNPFLIAQAAAVDGRNPFLEAMMPPDENPFK